MYIFSNSAEADLKQTSPTPVSIKIGNVLLFLSLFILFSCITLPREDYSPARSFYYNKSDYINYEIQGHGPQNLVFLHGYSVTLRSWEDLRSYFPENLYTCYFLDLKGHGYSSVPKDNNYSLKDNADIVSQFIQDEVGSDYWLLGSSMGGSIALAAYYSMSTDSLPLPKGLVLISPGLYPENVTLKMEANRVIPYSAILSGFWRIKPVTNFVANRVYYQKDVRDKFIMRYLYAFQNPGTAYSLQHTANQVLDDNVLEALQYYSRIQTPILLISGKNDRIVSPQYIQQFSKTVPNCTYFRLDNCGHCPQEEYPLAVSSYILNFIGK